MKVLKLQQNSEEWLEFRKGKSGGSQFKDLYIPGLPLKSKIVVKLEEFQPLPAADKKLTVKELADMLEPSELVELKLEMDPQEAILRDDRRTSCSTDHAQRLRR